jgi:hypothetical protein
MLTILFQQARTGQVKGRRKPRHLHLIQQQLLEIAQRLRQMLLIHNLRLIVTCVNIVIVHFCVEQGWFGLEADRVGFWEFN